ncbi:restriction endonuclease subunit S [Syntrophobacteraceae bacterium DRH4]|nr:restriction endonuclease subunit S [Desulfoferrobacter suflitae]MCK8601356.1 restriction endonuclease subunit S [Desulfoferrobacter suflitae]
MEWLLETLGEICRKGGGKIQTGPFGSQLHQSDYRRNGIPVVMPADIVGGKIAITRIARVSETQVERLKKHKLSKGDIVYGRRGDIGRQALVREENSGWLCGTGCLKISLGDGPLAYEYLHRYLSTPEVIGWIEGQAVGATMPNLNTGILERIPVFYPPTKESQRKIAAVLSAYDDLIENNKRRIALLEKMAEEIYREWFVRFRFPGHDKVKFEKGVPGGWEVLPFSKAVLINPVERISRDVEKPYIRMEDLSVSSMYFLSKEMRTGNAGSKFRNHDVLLPRITPSLENGKRGYVMTLEEDQVGIGSTEFIVLREKILTSEHIYLLTCSSDFRKHAELSMAGASGRQRVQENCFDFFLVNVPPQEIRSRFTQIVRPYFSGIKALSNENINLSSTRDLLLPRLISGKLSVENLDIRFPPSMEEADGEA